MATSELKYVAVYLGIKVERGSERAALELVLASEDGPCEPSKADPLHSPRRRLTVRSEAVLSSPYVKLSCSRPELTALSSPKTPHCDVHLRG